MCSYTSAHFVARAALKVCHNLQKGKKIHYEFMLNGNDIDVEVATTLVHMYARCGSMADAFILFSNMSCRTVVSWNGMIMGYATNGEGNVALQLYACMQEQGLMPNGVTFVAALKACCSLAAQEFGKLKISCLEKGTAIHSQVSKSKHDSNCYIATSLIDMYAKCGCIVDARRVFDKMQHHDVVAWNALVLGYAETGEGGLALKLYTNMQDQDLMPNGFTFVAALKACTPELGKNIDDRLLKVGCLAKGKAIHFQICKSGHESNIYVANTLIDMYSKCGSLIPARKVFDRMSNRSLVSWNVMMNGYAQNGEGDMAIQLYTCMQDQGYVPDAVTFVAALKACASLNNAKQQCLETGRRIHAQAKLTKHISDNHVENTLVDMYVKCGSMDDACTVFNKMVHRSVVSWTTMILGYAELGEGELSLQLYSQMREKGCVPDCVTFSAVLKACGCLGALEIGRKIHTEVSDAELQDDSLVATCLVDFYGKCGSMVDAQHVFDSIEDDRKDLVTWNALISGYCRQGDAKTVFYLFESMQAAHLQPNSITFLSLLTLCSHAGLVDKGKECFQAMCLKQELTPNIEHYACMIDLLARANYLDVALALILDMPFKPSLRIWASLLASCRKWTNVEIGRTAFNSILELDDNEATAYVLMANIYISAGMSEQYSEIMVMKMNAKVLRNCRASDP